MWVVVVLVSYTVHLYLSNRLILRSIKSFIISHTHTQLRIFSPVSHSVTIIGEDYVYYSEGQSPSGPSSNKVRLSSLTSWDNTKVK